MSKSVKKFDSPRNERNNNDTGVTQRYSRTESNTIVGKQSQVTIILTASNTDNWDFVSIFATAVPLTITGIQYLVRGFTTDPGVTFELSTFNKNLEPGPLAFKYLTIQNNYPQGEAFTALPADTGEYAFVTATGDNGVGNKGRFATLERYGNITFNKSFTNPLSDFDDIYSILLTITYYENNN